MFAGIIILGTSFKIPPAKDHLQELKNGKEVYIQYCQSCHMENGEGLEGVYPPVAKTNYLKNTTLKFFEQNLDPKKYVRVHRSYIVNTGFIRKLENYHKDSFLLILTTDHKINISRSGLQLLRKVLYI